MQDGPTSSPATPAARRMQLPNLALLGGVAALQIALHLLFPRTHFAIHPDFFVEVGEQHDDWGFSNESPYGPAQVVIARFAPWSADFSVNVLPLLFGAGSVFLCGLLARELGAGRFGMLLAAFALVASPYLGIVGGSLHSSNIELLLCAAGTLLVARILRGGSPRLWLAVGALCGVGVVNKQTMALFVIGLAPGLIATPARRHLRSGWLWAGCALGLSLTAPYLWWQARNGWPVFSHALDVRSGPWGGGLAVVGRLAGQLLALNIANLPLLLAGLVFLFRRAEGRAFRPLGISFAVGLAVMAAAGGKINYGLPMFAPLLAAGARQLGIWLASPARRKRRWLVPVPIAAVGLVLLPLSYPVLTPRSTAAYLDAVLPSFGKLAGERAKQEVGRCREVYLVDFVERLAVIYAELAPEERADCLLFTNFPVETAAANEFGPGFGLPRAFSSSAASIRKGPGDVSGETAIVFGVDEGLLSELYAAVDVTATLPSRTNACGSDTQPDTAIAICRGLRVPFAEAWSRLEEQPAWLEQ